MDEPFNRDFRWENLSEEEKEKMRAIMRARLSQPDLSSKPERERRSVAEPDSEEFARIRRVMAMNPNTPATVLHELAENGAPALLERIAEHPRAHAATLTNLAKHPAPEVRAAVGANSNTPIEVLWHLAADENPDVRYSLAENPHTDYEILRHLFEDDNPYVAYRAQKTLTRLQSDKLIPDQFIRIEAQTLKQMDLAD